MATAALIASGCVAAQAAPAAEPAAPGTFTLDILDINDFHGRIAQDRDSAGAAILAGAVDTLRAANPNTLFVSAGDNIGASTFASASQKDAPTIEALGAGGLDVSTVGNHEFDRGFKDLKGRVIQSYAKASGQDGADFALGANVYDKATGEPALKEYAIREVNGVNVGFIGTVTADVPSLVTPTGIKDLTFGNELEAVNRVAKQLSDGDTTNDEASVIVVLSHNGSENTSCGTIAAEKTTYGELVRGASEQVDAIVSGHTHQPYNCEIAGPTGTERPVVQAHQYGTTLGKISLEIDEASGEVASSSTELLPLAIKDDAGEWVYTPNKSVTQIVDTAITESEKVGNQKIGQISADILRGGKEPGSDRGVESTLGNTVADIHLWATSNEDFAGAKAQIAFMNAGGLRADLLYGKDGTVSYKAAADVQPFANTLKTFDLTGAQIREALEQQWQPNGSERSKLQLGISDGLSYTYVEKAPRGEHIKDITFNGEPLDEKATFHVVANAFLAAGGDNFAAFAEGTNHADSGQIDLDATVNYFKSHDVVDPAPLGRAMIAGTDWAKVELSTTEAEAGEDIEVTVTGLEEGAQITASSFGGELEITDIPAADAQGTTSFTLPIAEGTEAGDYELLISLVQRESISTIFTVVATEPSASPTPSESASPTASPSPTQTPDASGESTGSATPSASATPTDNGNQNDRDDLAQTGFSASWIGMAAGAIVLLGILLLLVRRFGNKNSH
ncbi:5'-nucleotidase C-terminal domain-containing protein [Glutamicibacter protophormiae]|uniref:bifunctional metallophosphatase/5'-nucleotidase n=1 Tax=Glutamicibacter protophormiae TaxID=37930 RepID=UPI002A80130B|nr:5'-nucleotidase C-terminal domain-containing protein [Glutamicibacter protophormiae]WPR65039.1 5'-nucleotidase C-terminal domain-containing protein [Glutamicibacter protophormiae]WPR68536.1 5'-nucleotidase C-terminal domain-containing protein [Glutamicibacter protophormiae]